MMKAKVGKIINISSVYGLVHRARLGSLYSVEAQGNQPRVSTRKLARGHPGECDPPGYFITEMITN
jgi:hypothetical protein